MVSSSGIEHAYLLSLVHKEKLAKGIYALYFRVPDELASSFQRPGQYISLKIKDTQAFYAMAHSPNSFSFQTGIPSFREKEEQRWEFLIKEDKTAENKNSLFLCSLQEKDSLLASPVMGNGFKLDFLSLLENPKERQALHLFSMGSALAPLRSLFLYVFGLEEDLKMKKEFREPEITLWQAALDEEHLPYKKEYVSWCDRGLRLKLCCDGVGGSEKEKEICERIWEAGKDTGKDTGKDSRKKKGGKEKLEISNKNPLELLSEKRPNLAKSFVCWAGSREFGQALRELCLELALPESALLDNLK